MSSSEHPVDVAGPEAGARYYRPDLRPMPVLFVQRKRSWSSFTPGGEMLEYAPGRIPESRMTGLEEMSEDEARRWLDAEFRQVTGGDGQVTLKAQRRGVVAAPAVVYKPRKWRQWVFGPAMLFIVAYVVFAVVTVARSDSNPDGLLFQRLLFGLALLVIVVFAVSVSIFRGRLSTYALTVDAKSIMAQAGFWRQRPSSILVAELDLDRSAFRSLLSRLFGWQYLYSKHGARVMFFRRHFDQRTARELLARLDMPLD
jgi:hypothetical protein